MANCPSTFWARWIKQNRPGEYGTVRSSIIYHRSWGGKSRKYQGKTMIGINIIDKILIYKFNIKKKIMSLREI